MIVQECKPEAQGFKECGVVFSGLDADVAGEIGECLVGSFFDGLYVKTITIGEKIMC
jgi:hypothetical protein